MGIICFLQIGSTHRSRWFVRLLHQEIGIRSWEAWRRLLLLILLCHHQEHLILGTVLILLRPARQHLVLRRGLLLLLSLPRLLPGFRRNRRMVVDPPVGAPSLTSVPLLVLLFLGLRFDRLLFPSPHPPPLLLPRLSSLLRPSPPPPLPIFPITVHKAPVPTTPPPLIILIRMRLRLPPTSSSLRTR